MDGDLHPEFSAVRWFPALPMGPRWLKVVRYLSTYASRPSNTSSLADIEYRNIPGLAESPDVPLMIVRPRHPIESAPAILWIHGGGMIMGDHTQDYKRLERWVLELGAVVVSVGYRLSPESKAPQLLDDCYAAWQWIASNARTLGVDQHRLAIAGESAGGGLAAATVHRIHDSQSPIQPILQVLVFPMLDDRTVLKYDDSIKAYVWDPRLNRFGWTSYLGVSPGSAEVPPYSVPARRTNLHGLPPVWLGVGTLDLFLEEDLEYVKGMRAAGIKAEVLVTQGGFHGFPSIFPKASPSVEFDDSMVAALRAAFSTDAASTSE